MKPHLPNVCQHLLVRPELLSDPMYAEQVKAAIEHDEKLAEHWEAASAELLTYATMLAHDMEGTGWAMPKSWQMWHERDHQPDKHWGQPLLDKLAALKAQRDKLAQVLQEYQDACGSLPGDGSVEWSKKAYRKIAVAYQNASVLLAKLEKQTS